MDLKVSLLFLFLLSVTVTVGARAESTLVRKEEILNFLLNQMRCSHRIPSKSGSELAGILQLTEVDWQYIRTSQDQAGLGLQNRQCLGPREKVIGGSSVLNFMLYVRGNRHDYDQWESLDNPGWSYDDVLQYLLKSEDHKTTQTDPDYHRKGGYLSASNSNYAMPLREVLVKAELELGYNNTDYNGRFQTGIGKFQAAMSNGFRCSKAKAFLWPAKNREIFYIGLNAYVTKILIDPVTKTAKGVAGGTEALGFVNTTRADPSTDWPEIEINAASVSDAPDAGELIWRARGEKKGFYKDVFEPLKGKDVWMLYQTLLRPKSVGSLLLRSINPFDPPILNPKYLTDPEDVITLIEGVQICLALGETRAFKSAGASLYCKPFKGCEQFTFNTDPYWECVVRHFTFTVHHPVGTCKMGPSSDPSAVADSKFLSTSFLLGVVLQIVNVYCLFH